MSLPNKNAADDVLQKGERRVKVGCRRPLKDNTCAWINIDGIITGEIVDSKPVALAVYSDISDPTRLKAERDQLLEEKTRYFEWMMDEYVGEYLHFRSGNELVVLTKRLPPLYILLRQR